MGLYSPYSCITAYLNSRRDVVFADADVRNPGQDDDRMLSVARLAASISCGRTATMTSTFYSTVSRQGETKRIAFGHDVAAEPNIRTLKRGGAERLESVRMFRCDEHPARYALFAPIEITCEKGHSDMS